MAILVAGMESYLVSDRCRTLIYFAAGCSLSGVFKCSLLAETKVR